MIDQPLFSLCGLLKCDGGSNVYKPKESNSLVLCWLSLRVYVCSNENSLVQFDILIYEASANDSNFNVNMNMNIDLCLLIHYRI